MRLRLQSEFLHRVADRWAQQYPQPRQVADGTRTDEVLRKLRALDPQTMTAAEVDAIIGNDSWTTFFCSGCAERSPVAVQFGSEFDQVLCPDCVTTAYRLLAEAGKSRD